jgi:L-lactate utilization protein LutC
MPNVTLKISELLDMRDPLRRILECKLPIKVAYRLSKNAKKIQTELQTIGATIDETIASFSEEEDGKKVLPPKNVDAANAKVTELLQEEIELDLDQVSMAMLSDSQATVAAADLMLCEKLFVE